MRSCAKAIARCCRSRTAFESSRRRATGPTPIALYKEVKPDLVIMDISMPGIGGVEAIRHIRQWDSSARILVFTMHQSAAYAVQAIKAGARGFVTKSSPPDTLLRAIGEVMAGRIALSPDIDHELAINSLAGEAFGGRYAEPAGIRNPAYVAGREIRR